RRVRLRPRTYFGRVLLRACTACATRSPTVSLGHLDLEGGGGLLLERDGLHGQVDVAGEGLGAVVDGDEGAAPDEVVLHEADGRDREPRVDELHARGPAEGQLVEVLRAGNGVGLAGLHRVVRRVGVRIQNRDLAARADVDQRRVPVA